ncbi:MAG: GAF domain-containing protein [Anaerolineae bacterium]|nr:GAF domain-containing protein [Anaerolineae bacterium]
MSKKDLKALQAELELTQKELKLTFAIDHIRDTIPEPAAMLTSIVNILADELQTDLCLLVLLDQETGKPELKAVNNRSKQLGRLQQVITRELAEQASQLDGVTIWLADEVLPPADLKQSWDKLQLAAVPIIMNEHERLGALLLARAKPPFSPAEIALLKTAEDQIDSAVIQGYAYHELQRRVKELETIYRIDHIRDQNLAFDEMLNIVLQELCRVIQAEMGFVMLYDRAGKRLELRAATDEDLFRVSAHYQVVDQIANESLRRAELVCHNDLRDGLNSMMCIPLILNDQIIGVLGVGNRYGAQGFDYDDCRLLNAIGSQMDTAIFENLEQHRLRQVLGRSVDPRIMQKLLTNPNVDFLKGERSVLTVLYADIRGSTRLGEHTDPELFVGFINHYLGQMTEIILSHEGTLDKFVGDEVMALFGAPFPQEDHALRAVRVGLAMQSAHQVVMDIWRERGVEAAPIGVGIATGEMIVGEMGCPQRADYTVIGKAANLGSRICGVTPGGQVFISQETYDLVKNSVEVQPITGLQFKGVERAITVYQVRRVVV